MNVYIVKTYIYKILKSHNNIYIIVKTNDENQSSQTRYRIHIIYVRTKSRHLYSDHVKQKSLYLNLWSVDLRSTRICIIKSIR